MVKPIEILEHIKEAWISIINSSTKELYVTYVTQLISVCTISIFLKYVESKILNKMKEKIICAWSDHIRHLANTTTNKVESTHATLKNWLKNSKRNFVRVGNQWTKWLKGNIMRYIYHFFETSQYYRVSSNEMFWYSHLIDNISRAGLNFIDHQVVWAEQTGPDSSMCGRTLRRIYSLLCACLIVMNMKLDRPIHMDEVNTHWKRLQCD